MRYTCEKETEADEELAFFRDCWVEGVGGGAVPDVS